MTVKDIFHQICNDQGISFSQAARNIGVSKGSLYNQMSKKSGMRMRLETLIKDFEELGCQIFVVDSETGEEYILDGEDDGIELFGSRKHENW